jgi:hypothetical protein
MSPQVFLFFGLLLEYLELKVKDCRFDYPRI